MKSVADVATRRAVEVKSLIANSLGLFDVTCYDLKASRRSALLLSLMDTPPDLSQTDLIVVFESCVMKT